LHIVLADTRMQAQALREERPNVIVQQHISQPVNFDGVVVVRPHAAGEEDDGRLFGALQGRRELDPLSQLAELAFDEIGGEIGHAVAKLFQRFQLHALTFPNGQTERLHNDPPRRGDIPHDAGSLLDDQLPPAHGERRGREMFPAPEDGRVGSAPPMSTFVTCA